MKNLHLFPLSLALGASLVVSLAGCAGGGGGFPGGGGGGGGGGGSIAGPTNFKLKSTVVELDKTGVAVVSVSPTTVVLSQAVTSTSTGTFVFSQVKYALPAAYDRLIDRTDWDKTQHWEMLGPETMQQVQWLKSGFISTGPRVRYYLIKNL